MRKKYIVFIFAILCLKTFAQSHKDDLKIMIDSAIKLKYSKALEQLSNSQDKRAYFDHLYIINEQNRSLNYLPFPATAKFNYIDVLDNRNIKIISKGIRAWKVVAFLDGNQFKINILDCFIRYRNHNYNFSNGGGATAIFQYDCTGNSWKLVHFENKGI